ncbi:MAG: F0F1 ATP synthase subunit gamma, partial [Gemmatimonadetes bacterium]|nr:F0F1 ATP synthase subunit gamma [Gemmatimonadota bacterium]
NLNITARNLLAKEQADGVEAELHVVGKKGITYFKRRADLAGKHEHFGDKPTYADVNVLAEDFIRRYSKGEIDRVTIVYQKFYSAGRQFPVAEVLLPLDGLSADGGEGDAEKPAAKPESANYLFSPEPEGLMKELLPAYFKTTLFSNFLQAVVGEHLARMVAMKNATDASNKLIKSLTRQYNRARQTQITNEISELMGGVEALK